MAGLRVVLPAVLVSVALTHVGAAGQSRANELRARQQQRVAERRSLATLLEQRRMLYWQRALLAGAARSDSGRVAGDRMPGGYAAPYGGGSYGYGMYGYGAYGYGPYGYGRSAYGPYGYGRSGIGPSGYGASGYGAPGYGAPDGPYAYGYPGGGYGPGYGYAAGSPYPGGYEPMYGYPGGVGGGYAGPGGGRYGAYGFPPAWGYGVYPGPYPGVGGWRGGPYGWPYTTDPDTNWWYMYGMRHDIPPYNRFLDRFFPGATGQMAWPPPAAWSSAPPPPPGPVAGGTVALPAGRCARITVKTTDEEDATITVRLPNLGASTPGDLELTIERQLSRGLPVVLRDASGYVVHLPPASVLTELHVKTCQE